MADLADIIISQSLTHSEAIKKLGVLKEYLMLKIFHSSPTAESAEAQGWCASLDPTLLAQINAKNIDDTFEGAEAKIKKINVLTVFVALDLPEEVIPTLVEPLRQSYGPSFLVEIKVDPGLIAGAALVWKGMEKDYSLRQKIRENRENILGMFAQYLKHD